MLRSTGMCESSECTGCTYAAKHRDVREQRMPSIPRAHGRAGVANGRMYNMPRDDGVIVG